MKFGGSSLANLERIDHVAKLIKFQLEAGYRPRAVVCSAMGKTTNSLLNAGAFALGEYMLLLVPMARMENSQKSSRN
jgi:aspartate kinase